MSFKFARGFRCTPERHLWSSGLELAVYHKIAALTWVKTRQEHGVYHSSIQNLANYFGVHHQSLQRAVSNLVNKSGWLDYVEPRRTGNPSARRLRVDSNGHKDLRVVTHDEWMERHPNANRCFVPDAMPWDGETKDQLAIALYRESKGNVKWHPNLMKSLRGKTGLTDSVIESAYHLHVAAMENEPRSARGWQSNAYKWVAEFIKSCSSPGG